MNREVLKVLVGSHNYGLNTPKSDKDYKIFVLPTFDDLYYGKKTSSSTIKDSNNEDYEVKDIRLLLDLLRKANPSYLEILFSVEVKVDFRFEKIWKFLMQHREEIVQYNKANFFNATWGTICEKAKSLRQKKYTASSKELFDKLGYDPKQMCHFMRLYELLDCYSIGMCFGDCISLNEVDSHHLLLLKNGESNWSEFYEGVITTALDSMELKKSYFTNTEEDRNKHKEIFAKLNDMVKQFIEDDLKGHLEPF